ncbi:MAG: LamG-like jellyroll fold domain-containing protein [Candidatus Neomarinimicrobiota bacterium]
MRRLFAILLLILPGLLAAQSDTTVVVTGESAVFTVDASDPYIAWQGPVIGLDLALGEQFTVTWSAGDEGDEPLISIGFLMTIGGEYDPVLVDQPNSGSAQLTAPALGTNFMLVELRAVDTFGNMGHDYSTDYFRVGDAGGDTTVTVSGVSDQFAVDAADPWVELTAPNGGEKFAQWEMVSAAWTAGDQNLAVNPVTLGIIPDPGGSFNALLEGLPNSGGASLTMPSIDTRLALLKILVKDTFGNIGWDLIDDYITVGAPAGGMDTTAVFSAASDVFEIDSETPYVDLLVPDGGETYLEGSTITVTWTADDPTFDSAPVQILMATEIGGIFETQTAFIANAGATDITAPLGKLAYGQVRVIAVDHYGNRGQDQSNGYLSVFETGTGAIQGYFSVSHAITGTLYLSLWYPGSDPELDPPDLKKSPMAVNLDDGEDYLYSFSNLSPGDGYIVRAFIDQTGSPVSGEADCDYGYDLAGYSDPAVVMSDMVTDMADFILTDCGDYHQGDYSLSFDGVDDYVEVSDRMELNPTAAITIAAWIYPRSWDGNNRILQKGLNDDQFILEAEGDQFEFVVNNQVNSVPMSLPPLNEWSFIVGRYDGSAASIYLNGVLANSIPLTGNLNATTDPLYIGGKSPLSPPEDFFDGLIDELILWNRALDPAEITLVMENSIQPAGEPGLIGYWNFIEGIGSVAHDESSIGNQGAVYGALWSDSIHPRIDNTPPAIPAGLEVLSGDRQALLTWTANSEGDLIGYTLYRGNDQSELDFLAAIAHPATGFTDTGLTNGQTYFYAVSAGDKTGNESARSVMVAVTPNGPPRWTAIPDTSFAEDDSLTLDPADYVYDDSDPPASLDYSISGGDKILVVFDPEERRFIFHSGPGAPGRTEQFSICASDPAGLTGCDTFLVYVRSINRPPVLTLELTTGEKHGAVPFRVTATDPENDALTFSFFYSTDNLQWQPASVEPPTAADPDKYQWQSAADLPDRYQSQVWLKLTADDGTSSVETVAGPRPLDNHVGTLVLETDDPSQELSGLAAIPYLIEDNTGDVYELIVKYLDSSAQWRVATLATAATGIGPAAYNGTVGWQTAVDLPDRQVQVLLAVTPFDGWQIGTGDTILLNVDNQAPPILTELSPATQTRITWYRNFSLRFSLPMKPESFPAGIRLVGDIQGDIPATFAYDQATATVTVKPTVGLTAADSVRLLISDNLTDATGDPFDGNKNGQADGDLDLVASVYCVKLLGDYVETESVDFDDLVEFTSIWQAGVYQREQEIGPAAGQPPALRIIPDGRFDFEDLMVFVQMWNWSAGFGRDPDWLARTADADRPASGIISLDVQYSGDEQLLLEFVADSTYAIGALELILDYDPLVLDFDRFVIDSDQERIYLTHSDRVAARLTFDVAMLKPQAALPGPAVCRALFLRIADNDTRISVSTDIRGTGGAPLERSRTAFEFSSKPPLPVRFALHQNYPNPFNPVTTINFDLPADGPVRIAIYDLLGREVRILQDGYATAGYKSIRWDGRDRLGRALGSGVYFMRMEAARFAASRKLILLK